MKRLFCCTLFLYWLVSVICPMLFFQCFGFYWNLDPKCPPEYMWKATIIVTITIFASILLINLISLKNSKLEKKETNKIGLNYLTFVFIFYIIGFGVISGFSIKKYMLMIFRGELSGGILSYIDLIANILCIFILYELYLDLPKRKEKQSVIIYIVYSLINASRAGVLNCVLVIICKAFSFKQNKKNKIRNIIVILSFIVVAPVSFLVITNIRDTSTDNLKVFHLIVARCSNMETAGLALYQAEEKSYEKKVFKEKYSLSNQIKLITNTLVIGSVFEDDVYPNTYYRHIFMGYQKDFVRKNYMSINLTLPIYFVLKYSTIPGIFISILVIVFCYLLCEKYRNNGFFRIFAFIGLWNLLYFFDWVHLFSQLERIFFAYFMFKLVTKSRIRLLSYCIKPSYK